MKAQREREKSERGKREEASYIKRGGGVKWSHKGKENCSKGGGLGFGTRFLLFEHIFPPPNNIHIGSRFVTGVGGLVA
jgi:hypothetical protein